MKLALATLLIASSLSVYADEEVNTKGPLGVQYSNIKFIKEKYRLENFNDYQVIHKEKGNYQVFVNTLGSVDISNIVEKKELFFGKQSDYFDKVESDIKESVAANSANGVANVFKSAPNSLMAGGSEALKGGVTGLGIGLIMSGIEHVVVMWQRNPEYYKVVLLTDKNGSTAKITSLFVCDTENYNDEEIRSLIVEKEKLKGVL